MVSMCATLHHPAWPAQTVVVGNGGYWWLLVRDRCYWVAVRRRVVASCPANSRHLTPRDGWHFDVWQPPRHHHTPSRERRTTA